MTYRRKKWNRYKKKRYRRGGKLYRGQMRMDPQRPPKFFGTGALMHKRYTRRWGFPEAIGPKQKNVAFKTCYALNIPTDAAADKSEDNVLPLNNPFAPVPGSASQPTGFDEHMAFYNKGRVKSVNIKISWVATAIAAQDIVIGLIPEAGNGASSLPTTFLDSISWEEWCEYPRAQHKLFPRPDTATNNVSVKYMKYHCIPHKFFNEVLKGNDNFDFTAAAGPINLVGLHVIYADLANVALVDSTTYFRLKVEITMNCVLYDRKNLARS